MNRWQADMHRIAISEHALVSLTLVTFSWSILRLSPLTCAWNFVFYSASHKITQFSTGRPTPPLYLVSCWLIWQRVSTNSIRLMPSVVHRVMLNWIPMMLVQYIYTILLHPVLPIANFTDPNRGDAFLAILPLPSLTMLALLQWRCCRQSLKLLAHDCKRAIQHII